MKYAKSLHEPRSKLLKALRINIIYMCIYIHMLYIYIIGMYIYIYTYTYHIGPFVKGY